MSSQRCSLRPPPHPAPANGAEPRPAPANGDRALPARRGCPPCGCLHTCGSRSFCRRHLPAAQASPGALSGAALTTPEHGECPRIPPGQKSRFWFMFSPQSYWVLLALCWQGTMSLSQRGRLRADRAGPRGTSVAIFVSVLIYSELTSLLLAERSSLGPSWKRFSRLCLSPGLWPGFPLRPLPPCSVWQRLSSAVAGSSFPGAKSMESLSLPWTIFTFTFQGTISVFLKKRLNFITIV